MSHEFERKFRELSYLVEDMLRGEYRQPRNAAELEPPRPAAPTAPARPPAQARPQEAPTAPARPPAAPTAQAYSGQGSDLESEQARLNQQIRHCTLCPLSGGRTQAVPGVGVLNPLVLVVGEGPGAEEDRLGEPFVGPAGRYLDDWLRAIELSRQENVYITNVVKCRPPGNRDPEPAESAACRPYLERQIQLLQPRVIFAAGRVAAQVLIGSELGIGKLRGKEHRCFGIPLVATYHPSAVLRNPDWRRPVWEDLKLLRSILDL